MYRRTNARILSISDDLHDIKIVIKLNYKNRNYVGSMFGGSLFAATDPIYMTQLMQILGDDYVVWDKSTNIKFKRPAYEKAYAHFSFTKNEINAILEQVASKKEMDYVKIVPIISKNDTIFTTVEKTIYISTKSYYKEKLKSRKNK